MHERVAECFENEFTFADGKRGWFELRIEPVPEAILVLSIDVTMRRELERGLSSVPPADRRPPKPAHAADVWVRGLGDAPGRGGCGGLGEAVTQAELARRVREVLES